MIRAQGHLKLCLAAWWPTALLQGDRTHPAPGPSPGLLRVRLLLWQVDALPNNLLNSVQLQPVCSFTLHDNLHLISCDNLSLCRLIVCSESESCHESDRLWLTGRERWGWRWRWRRCHGCSSGGPGWLCRVPRACRHSRGISIRSAKQHSTLPLYSPTLSFSYLTSKVFL